MNGLASVLANVLAIDTCFGAVSVAVRSSDASSPGMHSACEAMTAGHAERLIPMIAEVMDAARTTFPSIKRLAVTIGPGTFTGVRTGIAAARALSLAAGGVPVVGTTSLAVMMHDVVLQLGAARDERPIAIAVDARRGEVYFQLFGATFADPLTEPGILSISDAAARLPAGPCIVAGSGAQLLAAVSGVASSALEPMLEDLQPHARTLALMSDLLPVLDPVNPLYLRPPDAKPQTGKSLPRVAE